MTSDVNNIQNTAIMTMRTFSACTNDVIFRHLLCGKYQCTIISSFMVAVPILVLSLALIISTAFPRFRKLQQATDGINRTLQENFIGIRVVKSFVRETFEKKKFGKENSTFRERALHAMYVVMWNNPIMQLTIYAVTIAVMWFGGGLVISGTMTTGDLISFISYITQILMSLMMISSYSSC